MQFFAIRNPEKILFLLLLLLIATVSCIVLDVLGRVPLYARDEVLYIYVGKKYVEGTPPLRMNAEHPPLAKYFIGLFALYGFEKLYPYLSTCITIAILYYIATQILGTSSPAAFVTILAFFFDPVTISLARCCMLDDAMLSFVALGTLFALKWLRERKRIHYVLMGLMFGLALACKLSSLYVVVPVVICVSYLASDRMVRKFLKNVFGCLSIASITFLTSFVADLVEGLQALVDHLMFMVSYMSWRHGFSPIIALNGYLTFLTKLEVWKLVSVGTVVIANGTIVYSSFEHVGRTVMEFKPLLGSLSWPLLTVWVFKDFRSRFTNPSKCVLVAWLLGGLASLIHGNIFWYYLLPLPPLYMLSLLERPRVAAIVASLNVAQVIIAVLGIATNICLYATL